MKSNSISLTLSQDMDAYLTRMAEQRSCKKTDYIRELIREDKAKNLPMHTGIVESLCKITGDLQKMKRRSKNGHTIGMKELEDLERELQYLWEKI